MRCAYKGRWCSSSMLLLNRWRRATLCTILREKKNYWAKATRLHAFGFRARNLVRLTKKIIHILAHVIRRYLYFRYEKEALGGKFPTNVRIF